MGALPGRGARIPRYRHVASHLEGNRLIVSIRLRYVALTVATISVGLLVHLGGGALPADLRDVTGDALWAAMIYWITGVVAPSGSRAARAIAAIAVCAAVEGSQLLHAPWLDQVRATTLGHLVLGSDFDVRDLVAYAAGVAFAGFLDSRRALRSRGPEDIS